MNDDVGGVKRTNPVEPKSSVKGKRPKGKRSKGKRSRGKGPGLVVLAFFVLACVAAMGLSGYLQATIPEEPEAVGRDQVSSYDSGRIDEVAEALRDTEVYTDPYYESELADSEREELTSRLKALDVEVRIAALVTSEGDESAGNAGVIADRIARTLGEDIGPVVVVVVSDWSAEYSGYQYDTDVFGAAKRPTFNDSLSRVGLFMGVIVSSFASDPPEADPGNIPPPNAESYAEEDADPGLRLWGYPLLDGLTGVLIGLLFGPVLGLFLGLVVLVWKGVRKK